jgi:hypothetical protein
LDFHNGLLRKKRVVYKSTEVQQNRRKRSGTCRVDARKETARKRTRGERRAPERERRRERQTDREKERMRESNFSETQFICDKTVSTVATSASSLPPTFHP